MLRGSEAIALHSLCRNNLNPLRFIESLPNIYFCPTLSTILGVLALYTFFNFFLFTSKKAGRVLKPGGRFLFVESAEVDGESFLEEILKMSAPADDGEEADDNDNNESTEESTTIEENEDGDDSMSIIFSEVGYDNVDMVLTPHVAGVAIKALDADLTSEQRAELKTREERDRMADLSLDAFERGNRRNKRRRKKTGGGGAVGEKKEMGMKK